MVMSVMSIMALMSLEVYLRMKMEGMEYNDALVLLMANENMFIEFPVSIFIFSSFTLSLFSISVRRTDKTKIYIY